MDSGAAAFFAGDFFAVDLLAVVFLGAAFFVVVFLAVVFFADGAGLVLDHFSIHSSITRHVESRAALPVSIPR
jgi:hypothetical protein